MKLGLIVPGFSADEKDWCIPALLDLVRVLARGNSVHVFALEYPYRRDNYDVYGAAVHSLGGRNRGKIFAPRLWTRAFGAIHAEHRRGRFDLLHAIWANKPGMIALLATRILGIPLVATIAGGELAALSDIAYGGQLQILERMMIGTVVRNADRVTAGSRYLRRMALAHRSKVDIVPFGVDTELFSIGERKPTRTFKLLNVGSLVPVKGHGALIEAVASLGRSDVCLEIVGTGALMDQLSARASTLGISQTVKFSGSTPHHQLANKYREADLFVQSARHEAQGMAVLEAAACGTGITGTPVGVLPELVEKGAAISARGFRSIDLAAAIGNALEQSESLRCKAREVSADDYGLEVTCSKWTHLYQEILSSRAA